MDSKVIIITGGNKGLGKKIFNELSKYNYKIATFGKTEKQEENENILKMPIDITKREKVKKFINKVLEKWGKIDILINNAGIVDLKPFLEYTEKDYNKIFDVNVKGAFLISQFVIKNMKEGYIINIGSTRSITGAPNKSLYSMSKFALRSLTQCINEEFDNIRSTIICPGKFKKEENSGTVEMKNIAKLVKFLIDNPKNNHIPEVIIGGKL